MEAKDIISSGILELHATGLCSQLESEQVYAWAAAFPEVRAELDAIERTMESYAMLHAVEPAKQVRDSVLREAQAKIGNDRKTFTESTKVVGIAPFWKYAAAASIILLLGSAILNYVYYNKYEQAQASYQQSQQELLAVNDRLSNLDEDMSVVRNKYSQPVSLEGLPAAPDAAAKVFWMKNTGEVYIDPSNLPDAPAGKQYQLWGIVDGKPVDGGMIITTDKANKYEIQKMKSFGNVKVQAFAVTLETAGGNPTPKGEMYVLGEM